MHIAVAGEQHGDEAGGVEVAEDDHHDDGERHAEEHADDAPDGSRLSAFANEENGRSGCQRDEAEDGVD